MQWQRYIYPYSLFYPGNLERVSFASEKCNFTKRFVDRGLPGSLLCKRLSQRKTARINIVLSYWTSNIYYKSKLQAFISQRSMREEENRSVTPWILQVRFLTCLLVLGFCCLFCSFFGPPLQLHVIKTHISLPISQKNRWFLDLSSSLFHFLLSNFCVNCWYFQICFYNVVGMETIFLLKRKVRRCFACWVTGTDGLWREMPNWVRFENKCHCGSLQQTKKCEEKIIVFFPMLTKYFNMNNIKNYNISCYYLSKLLLPKKTKKRLFRS